MLALVEVACKRRLIHTSFFLPSVDAHPSSRVVSIIMSDVVPLRSRGTWQGKVDNVVVGKIIDRSLLVDFQAF